MFKRVFAFAAIAAASAGAQADNISDLGWDLSYRPVMDASQLAENEFIRVWAGAHPLRITQQRMASYQGKSIVASVLIERPWDDTAAQPG